MTDTFSVFVHDTIAVSDSTITGEFFGLVVIHVEDAGVTLEEYKKALGPFAHELSEAQIQRVFTLSEKMARVLFDMWNDSNKVK